MKINFKCGYCGELYLCCLQTTKIFLPQILTECPKCKKEVVINESKFLDKQVVELDLGRLKQASLMINMAKQISRDVNDDYPPLNKIRKRKKNDLSDV